MARGRPRKPLEVQAAESRGDGLRPGGHKPAPLAELALRPVYAPLPVAPDDLEDRGRTEWEKIWSAGRWLKEDQDYHWVAIVARAYDEMETYRERVAEDGLIARGYAGQVVAHPLIAEIRKCETVIMKCLSQLGFSPTDRARLGIAEVKRQTSLLDLQQRTKENRA